MPAAYEVRIKRSAEKEVLALPPPVLRRVVSAIRKLAVEQRPAGSQKLVGAEAHRIRVGVYRILYNVDDVARVVEVLAVAHRKDV